MKIIKMKLNNFIALLIFIFLFGIAVGYAWHFQANRWASTCLYYYMYGHKYISCPTFVDKDKHPREIKHFK